MKITDVITEAASPAQQAAIAVSMKKAGKKPKQGVAEGSESDAYGNTGEKHECGSCDGTGIDTHDDECPECGGKGWVRDKESSKKKGVAEEWSQKYKKSINCSHPKGFSQKAHCAGKQKHNESIEMEMVCEDCGMCQSHGSLNEIAKGAKDANSVTKCWPGKHAEGTKTGKNGGQVRNCVPNESVEEAKHGLYYNVNKRKAAGTSRPASSPKAPTAQAWKDAAKTAKNESVAEDQLDELSKDTLKDYMRAQPARIKGPAGLATTNPKKAARIVNPEKGDMRRALTKLKDPAYGQQGVAEDSIAAMRRLAGIVTPTPAVVSTGQRQYRHMPTAVQPR